MKLVKTASGKQQLKISKKEWYNIGKTSGWMKSAQASTPSGMTKTPSGMQSATAVADTASSMVQNLQVVSNQLQSLIKTLDDLSKGTQISQPETFGTMIDQMNRLLESTKRFVPSLVMYINNSQPGQQPS